MRDIVHRPGEMREALARRTRARDKWGEGLVAGRPGRTRRRRRAPRVGPRGDPRLREPSTRSTPASAAGASHDIAEPLQVEFQELFAYPGEEATDFEVQDDHVDLETLVRDAIVLSLPFQPVCQPDCPGLDPATGERLAESAGAEQREPPDSRWAALQDYTPDHDDEACARLARAESPRTQKRASHGR